MPDRPLRSAEDVQYPISEVLASRHLGEAVDFLNWITDRYVICERGAVPKPVPDPGKLMFEWLGVHQADIIGEFRQLYAALSAALEEVEERIDPPKGKK